MMTLITSKILADIYETAIFDNYFETKDIRTNAKGIPLGD